MTQSLFYVGACNRALPYFPSANGEGIAAFRLDEARGTAEPLGVTHGIDNPTFLAVAPNGKILCATSEVFGWNEGTVTAYEIDPASGALSYINMQPTRGDIAAHLSFSADSRYVAVANYSLVPMTARPNRAVVVYPLGADGELAAPSAQTGHSGSGPDAARQERPHAHCVGWTPDGRYLVVADLGIDRLVIYGFDAQTGTLQKSGEAVVPPGSGPRHFSFHPDRPFLYCVNELASTLVSFAYTDGDLTTLASAATVPSEAVAHNHCSGVKIAPDGRHLYVGNRGHDSIGHFEIDGEGIARFRQTFAAGGKTPRDLAFSPSGKVLAVANQDSDLVTFLAYAPESGALTGLGEIATGTPTAIAFCPDHPKG